MNERDQDRRVDELRQQLRSLGYLDAGVTRFVLGPATGARTPVTIALLASLRVGLLAALLLGPAAAIGLNGRLPGLVTSPRDAIVVALYLGALFGAGVTAAAFLLSLLVASLAGERIGRRAHPLSRAAGAAVAIACLGYLTLWWRTANAGFGWTAPVWTGFALTVAVAISLLLGHVVSAAAFAVIIARRAASEADREPPGSSSATWKMTVLAALLAFAGAGALLVVTAPREVAPRAAAPLAVVSSGLRVRLIAIDGVDPAVLEQLTRSGVIPRLAGALAGSRARLTLDDGGTRDPARAWTTVATGTAPADHGVHGLETRRLAGVQGAVSATGPSRLGRAMRVATDLLRLTRPSIASGSERRVKTMWEVASDAGLRTTVVNWWATWPAYSARDGEIVLSDRATLRLEHGGVLDGEIAPASLYDALRARWSVIRAAASARARAASDGLPWGDAEARAVIERSAELDVIQLQLTREVSMQAPDLSVVYLPGLDIAQNALLGGQETALAASAVASRLEALRSYYLYLDRLLADELSPASGEVVVVVTEPGRVAAADGLIGVVGGPAARERSPTGRAADVAPTVLHVLGLPVSRELAGRPLTDLLSDDFNRRYPLRQVDTYGRPAITSPVHTGQPLDQEMIDRLRSLGYVK